MTKRREEISTCTYANQTHAIQQKGLPKHIPFTQPKTKCIHLGGGEVLNSKLASQLSLEASMLNLFMSSSIFLNQFPISRNKRFYSWFMI